MLNKWYLKSVIIRWLDYIFFYHCICVSLFFQPHLPLRWIVKLFTMHKTLFSPVYFKPFLTFLTFQQYVNWELPDVQVGFRKDRGTGDQIANIHWSIKKARVPKRRLFCFINYAKAFDCVDHNKLWKILKELGIPDYLTCLLRNLYAGQEATVRTGHGTMDWFQIGKGIRQGCTLSLCLFNLYAEYIMQNAWLDEVEAGIKVPEEISITSDMQMTPPLWQKGKRN